MRRLCERCIQSRLRSWRSLVNLPNQNVDIRRLLNSLPSCTLDAWGKYGGIASPGRTHHENRGFDVKVFTKRYGELQAMQANGANEEEKEDWFALLQTEMHAKAEQLEDLEQFSRDVKGSRKSDSVSTKKTREKYFEEKALTLDPPLESKALHLIDAFKSAVKTGRAPTETCWQTLKPKLEAQRQWAEKMVSDDAAEEARMVQTEYHERINPRENLDALLEDRHRKENGLLRPEIEHLDEIVDSVLQHNDLGVEDISLEDLVALVLARVWEQHHQSSDPRKQPLLMADTEWVINTKIASILPDFNSEEGALVDRVRYRCPGCASKQASIERAFPALLTHISNAHSRSTVGDFVRWRSPWPLRSPRQILAQAWPRNLPLLGRAQPSTGRWDLDAAPQYARSASNARAPPPVDPWKDRTLSSAPSKGFVEDVVGALDALADARLDMKLKSQIAFAYGVRRFQQAPPPPADAPFDPLSAFLDLGIMHHLHERLILAGYHTAFEGLACGHCADGASGTHARTRSKGGRKSMELGQLLEHYRSRYEHPLDEWMERLFHFPEGAAMVEGLAGCERARRVFDELFPAAAQDGQMGTAA